MFIAISNYEFPEDDAGLPLPVIEYIEDAGGIEITEIDALDNEAFRIIEESSFAFVHRAELDGHVDYEVYVERPLTDLKAETEKLSEDLRNLWAEYVEDPLIRVSVLNYGNMEIVDIVAENGKTVFKRK